MKGRGRGLSRQMKGRGTGRGKAGRTKSTTSTSPKGLSDYFYYIGSAKQASDYVVVTKYLINHIRKTYTFGDDIAEALEKRAPMDFNKLMPTLQVSDSSDEATKARENKQFEMLYEAEIASFVKRKDVYKSNLGNAYAFLYGQCNKAMQNKIQAWTDFESTIKNDPIKLLEAIQQQSITYQEKM